NMLFLFICRIFFFAAPQEQDFKTLVHSFNGGYQQLNIPDIKYDYTEYFNSIQGSDGLQKQLHFFSDAEEKLKKIDRSHLSSENKIVFDHIQYETEFNLKRIHLESEW